MTVCVPQSGNNCSRCTNSVLWYCWCRERKGITAVEKPEVLFPNNWCNQLILLHVENCWWNAVTSRHPVADKGRRMHKTVGIQGMTSQLTGVLSTNTHHGWPSITSVTTDDRWNDWCSVAAQHHCYSRLVHSSYLNCLRQQSLVDANANSVTREFHSSLLMNATSPLWNNGRDSQRKQQ